jgi:hypothetical protein
MTIAVKEKTGTAPVKPWRTLLIWLHAMTSFAWMAQALALVTLIGVAAAANSATGTEAMHAAVLLDMKLLAPLANASAFTGFMLAAATPWGYFRYWWVLGKFAITVVQLYIGIFLLSGALRGAWGDVAAGGTVSWWPLGVGTVAMAGAIAFQGWMSLAKPWRRTPWAAQAKPPTARRWVFVVSVAAVAVDVAIGLLVGFPAPVTEVLVLLGFLIYRARRLTQPNA